MANGGETKTSIQCLIFAVLAVVAVEIVII
jgi:hypothetical protein